MKKIAVCVNLDEKSYDTLQNLEKHFDLSTVDLHLVHSWNVEARPLRDSRIVAFYPNKEQAEEINNRMEEELLEARQKVKGLNPENFHVKVLNSSAPKRAVVEFLKKNNFDLVVCLTPEKDKLTDFFHSSFTNYLAAHAPCDLLMVRQR